MNVKILTLVIVLLVSLLCSASAGEYRSGQPRRRSSLSAFSPPLLPLCVSLLLSACAAVVDE